MSEYRTWEEAAAAAAGEVGTEMATLRLTQYHLARLVDATIMQMALRPAGTVHPRNEYVGMAVTAVNGYQQATGNRDALATVVQTIAGKQRDYGHDNIARFGETGLVVRLSDKAARLINLLKRQTHGFSNVLDVTFAEPITDTWLDIAGYCVIALMWLDGTFLLPLEADA